MGVADIFVTVFLIIIKMLILTDVISLNDDLIVVDVIPLVVVKPPCYDNNIVILQPYFEVML